ncbi:MAG TPA: hypothetical protein VK891_09705, partial [Euzebyales bacterium]|nr:hypothetical protein [Euzebyales bacterium]
MDVAGGWRVRAQGRRAAMVVLAFMLAGCTSPSPAGGAATSPSPAGEAAMAPSPSPSATASVDLTASIVQYRRDVAQRLVKIKIANGSDQDVQITLERATLPGYETAPGRVRTTRLFAGRRVDMPTQLGAPACDTPLSGTPTATVQIVTEGGQTTRATVPITDERGLIERVHAHDCAIERVKAAVDITVSDTWQQVGSGADAAVTGHVVMALRPGGGSARITNLDSGLLLRVESGGPRDDDDPTYTVDERKPRMEWDVELVGGRCDAHAVAEANSL